MSTKVTAHVKDGQPIDGHEWDQFTINDKTLVKVTTHMANGDTIHNFIPFDEVKRVEVTIPEGEDHL